MSDDAIFIDLGLEKLMKSMKFLDKTVVEVGITGEAADKPTADGRLTIGQAAIIDHYGTKTIPPRPFVTSVMNSPVAMPAAADIVSTALSFGNVDGALNRAGEKLAEEMRDAIYKGDRFVANAPATVAKKGFDHPLIDTSTLVDAIGHRLVRGSGDIVDAGAGSEGEYESYHVEGGE